MLQPEPNRDSEAFLSALAEELSTPPDELTARRQVAGAAFAARSARIGRRSAIVPWVAAVTVATTLFGSGGIAVAGGLPAPLQTVVADIARALPVPVQVPYPTIAGQAVAAGGPAERMPRPEDGEVEVEPYRAPTSTTARPPAEPSVAAEPGSDAGLGGEGDDRSFDSSDWERSDEANDRYREEEEGGHDHDDRSSDDDLD